MVCGADAGSDGHFRAGSGLCGCEGEGERGVLALRMMMGVWSVWMGGGRCGRGTLLLLANLDSWMISLLG